MTEHAGRKPGKNPEVTEKASRRRFTAEYKRRISLEAERCTQPGEIGALLRREGLYSSVVQRWRRQLREESLSSSKKSNGTPSPAQPSAAKEIVSLKSENERLKERLRQAELIIDVQKKSLGDDADAVTREDRLKAAEGLAKRVGVSAACRRIKCFASDVLSSPRSQPENQAKTDSNSGTFSRRTKGGA